MRHGRCIALLAGVVGAAVGEALAQRGTPVQVVHPSGAAFDDFGDAVAIDGDTMVVGVRNDTVGTTASQGSAHVYRWSGSGWVFETTLLASDGL
ncbi:MAG: FG-GAP repeat protein, partial [Planctomycetota bacterium]|nr:FG-GAP repeat protein [Planctomycetota bacterium]